MIDKEYLTKRIGVWITLFVKTPHMSKPFCFHGKIIRINDDMIYFDDCLDGETPYKISDIVQISPMNRFEMQRRAIRMENVGWQLRVKQAEERIKDNINKLR